MVDDIPALALSVREQWAWAILCGGKDVENRSVGAVRHMHELAPPRLPRRIALHAASTMTREEYEGARDFMAGLGVTAPAPRFLVFGQIVGVVTVTAVVRDHPSPWFNGPRGLVLADPVGISSIPAIGALGLFRWRPGGPLREPLPWMVNWRPPEPAPRGLFDE